MKRETVLKNGPKASLALTVFSAGVCVFILFFLSTFPFKEKNSNFKTDLSLPLLPKNDLPEGIFFDFHIFR